MNNQMIELNDEQLDMVAGGGGSSYDNNGIALGFEQQLINKINTSVNINTIVSPTVAVTLFSKNVNVNGAQSLIQNGTHQG